MKLSSGITAALALASMSLSAKEAPQTIEAIKSLKAQVAAKVPRDMQPTAINVFDKWLWWLQTDGASKEELTYVAGVGVPALKKNFPDLDSTGLEKALAEENVPDVWPAPESKPTVQKPTEWEGADAQQDDVQLDEKPAEPVKPKPPLGSKEDLALKRAAAEAKTAKEKAYRMALSSAKTLHTDFLESKNWKPDPGNKLKFATKPWRGIKLEGDAKDIEMTHEAKIDFTTKLAPWIYNITIPSNVDANSVSLYLRGNSDQPIGMDGNPVQAGKSKCAASFESGKKVRISIPDNCKITHFQVTLSGKNKVFHVDDITVEAVSEENLVANQ